MHYYNEVVVIQLSGGARGDWCHLIKIVCRLNEIYNIKREEK